MILVNNNQYIVKGAFNGNTQDCIDDLSTFSELAFDIETTGLDCHTDNIFCMQFYTGKITYVVDLRYVDVQLFKQILETKTLVGVNLKFDVKFLFKQNIFPKYFNDLMLNEINCYNGYYADGEIEYGFKGLSKKYLKEDLNKSLGAAFSVKDYAENLFLDELTYAAKDVENLLKIKTLQAKNIKSRDVSTICNLENKALYPIARMEFNGVNINKTKWQEVTLKIQAELKECEKELNNKIIDNLEGQKIQVNRKIQDIVLSYETRAGEAVKISNIKWSSPAQVLEVFNKYNLKLSSTSSVDLKEVSHIIITMFQEWKKLDSLNSKFLSKLPEWLNPTTGYIHADFWQIVSSGRMSCRNPNLQQIPSKGPTAKDMRACYIGDPGELLVTTDYSNMEARLAAEISGEDSWINAFINGEDLHSNTAVKTFEIDISKVRDSFPGNPSMTYRDVAKSVNFGIIYGAGASKLAQVINSDINKAKEVLENYFKATPKLEQFLKNARAKSKLGVVRTPFFNRARFFNLKKGYAEKFKGSEGLLKSYERQAGNTIIQGANADCTKNALILIQNYIDLHNFPAKIRLIVHDKQHCCG